MQHKGLFLVIEGTDGSGKGTQARLLIERLRSEGYDVAEFDFPQYEQESSYFVREYLNGKYGTAEEVGPYTGSLFYALDRYQAAPQIREALEAGKVVIANRFTGSNMAHQGTKFANAEERRGYFIWLENLEFEMLRIPRPAKSIVLRVPADIAQRLVDAKEARSYTSRKRDLHEADLGHLQRAVDVYDDMCSLFPNDFTRIDCVRNNRLMDIDQVQTLLWEAIYPLLPPKTNVASAVTAKKEAAVPEEPYVKKTDSGYRITAAGKAFLKDAVTSSTDNVYAFTSKLSPVTIAAAMARLSRRGDDMRITILDEFAEQMGKDEKLLQRVISAYGDDSVQQLAGLHIVVENASILLTKKLEWGRLGAYLEQSTRYIYYDQKGKQGNYKYLLPTYFPAELQKEYKTIMDQIFDLYSQVVRQLTDYVRSNSSVPAAERDIAWQGATRAQACDAARAMLPIATQSTVGMFLSGQALESLVMHLLSDDLPEAEETGHKILKHARQVIPTFLERADKPERGGATIAYRAETRKRIKGLAEQWLPQNHTAETHQPAQLMDYWPRNEFDIVADMLYEHSDQPLAAIREAVDQWPYAKKAQVFDAYMGERLNRRHRPGRALEKIHYSWDLTCEYAVFKDLMRHRMVDDMQWQDLSPRFGYDIPQLVEDAGLSEAFEQNFDLSAQLYSKLQAAGYALEAQYATLHGHRMRWKVTYNARQAFHLHELRTSPQGHPGYRKLTQQMHDRIAEIHPLIASAMRFVNQDEDPELARLAAERYTQFKLQQLK
jgi:thymidylate kinase/thymidylate synthase ThyX